MELLIYIYFTPMYYLYIAVIINEIAARVACLFGIDDDTRYSRNKKQRVKGLDRK